MVYMDPLLAVSWFSGPPCCDTVSWMSPGTEVYQEDT